MRALVPLLPLVIAACSVDTPIAPWKNRPPTARIDAPAEGVVVRAGAAVTLRGTVSDVEHDPGELVVTWRAGEVVLCEAPASDDGVTTCEARLDETAEVVLQARDPDEGVGVDALTVEVVPNVPPTAAILTPAEGSDAHYSDVPIRFTAVVGDDVDDPAALTVVWSGEAGALDITGPPAADGALDGAILLDAGEHTVTLTVADTEGGVTRADVSFTVGGPNAAPTCAITAPADGVVVGEGEALALEGTLTDDDHVDDPLTWTWSSDLDGALATGTGDAAASVELSPGAHTLTLTGADEAGATCEATVAVTVNARPSVTLHAPSPGAAHPGGAPIAFAATVLDDDTAPDALTLRWESDLDGLLDTAPADPSGAAGFDAALSRGTHTVTLTATDAHGLDGSADVVVVVVNSPPGAPVVALTPVSPTTGDDLVAHVTTPSVDPEGDDVTYTYAWTVDGAATAHTSDTVPHTATRRGEVWSVTVTPHDPHDAGATGVASVTIGDAPPTLDAVTLGPDPARAGDLLTCAPGAASDPDGDAVSFTYRWTVDGADVGHSGATLGDLAKGDVVVCEVTPVAGGLAGAPVASTPVTIADTPPVTTSVTLTPASAFEGSTLTCAATGADADGDAITWAYGWTVGGAPVVPSPGASLTGAAFDKGDVVTCAARPTADGVSGAEGTSNAVTILNSPPGSPGVAVTPERPAIGEDDLTCVVTEAAPDADGDALTYEVAWTVDGQPYPGAFPDAVGPRTTTLADDTVPADDLGLGYDWTCTVTARDDEGDGGSADASTPRAVCDGATLHIAYLPGWGDYAAQALVWAELQEQASTYGDCVLAFTDLGPAFEGQLPSYDVAILQNPAGGNVIYSTSQVAAIRAFAADGGGLLGTGFFLLELAGTLRDNSGLTDLFGVEPSGLLPYFGGASLASGTVVGAHPITRGVPSTFEGLSSANEQANVAGWTEDDLLPGARFVLHGPGETSVVAYEGAGSAVYFSGLAAYRPVSHEGKQVLYDALVWAAGYR